MKKFILLLGITLLLSETSSAQGRRDYDNDDYYQNNPSYPNQGGYQTPPPPPNYNPYGDPNYYPPSNGRCGTPPPPPTCHQPVPVPVYVPQTYCRPVVINPAPVVSFGFGYNTYRPYNYGYRKHFRRHHGHRGRW